MWLKNVSNVNWGTREIVQELAVVLKGWDKRSGKYERNGSISKLTSVKTTQRYLLIMHFLHCRSVC